MNSFISLAVCHQAHPADDQKTLIKTQCAPCAAAGPELAGAHEGPLVSCQRCRQFAHPAESFQVAGANSRPVQLLGLNWRETYLDPQLIHAYEELSAAPVEDGFTTQAAQGRAVLLQEAVQVLLCRSVNSLLVRRVPGSRDAAAELQRGLLEDNFTTQAAQGRAVLLQKAVQVHILPS